MLFIELASKLCIVKSLTAAKDSVTSKLWVIGTPVGRRIYKGERGSEGGRERERERERIVPANL